MFHELDDEACQAMQAFDGGKTNCEYEIGFGDSGSAHYVPLLDISRTAFAFAFEVAIGVHHHCLPNTRQRRECATKRRRSYACPESAPA